MGDPFFDAGAFNLVKFILSITAVFFDLIFFFQFAIYRGNKPKQTLPDLDTGGKGMLDEVDHSYDLAPSKTTSHA